MASAVQPSRSPGELPTSPDVAPPGGDDGSRHFNGLNTRMVVQYLMSRQPAGTLERVLERAGEVRPVSQLLDDASWSSYDQFRRLLEATEAEVGREELPRIAPSVGTEADPAESVAPIQELGDPAAVLQAGVDSGSSMGMSSVARIVGGEPVGAGTYRLRWHLVDGFAPFPALCAYLRGLMAVVPTVFGLAPADVDEDACECDGAPHCQFTIRWKTTGTAEEAVAGLRARLRVLEDRLESFESTVAEVVSSNDVGRTVARIAGTAARAMRAPAHAVVLDEAGLGLGVRAVGMDEETAAETVCRADLSGDRDVLVAPIVSGMRTFGRLAVLEKGRVFRPHERRSLLSYARLAAAALDSATAVAEARRQAGTASTLLRLSTALGQVMTSDEMATVLARAVPEVIDCDRAVVVLADQRSGRSRIAGAYGYPTAVHERLVTTEFDLPPSAPPGHVEILRFDEADEPIATELMRASGSVAAALVPMVVDGVTAGQVVAAVTERPERLAHTADLEDRLRGIASLGAAAARNGMLVDTIRHQATHDALTDLPNRVLILDRLSQLLKRRRRGGRPTAVLFLDLDGFKDVNDTLGHEAGDRLLQATAQRLRKAVREADTVGRLGGDEFVVVVDGDEAGPTPEAVAERILAQLRQPFPLDDGRSLTVTASIGIAVGAVGEAGDLLRDADVALYEAKAAGKSRAVRFRPGMGREAQERFERELDLQGATAP